MAAGILPVAVETIIRKAFAPFDSCVEMSRKNVKIEDKMKITIWSTNFILG